MKNKKSEKKKYYNKAGVEVKEPMNPILKGIINVYLILFYALFPMIIALLPVIPYIINEKYCWSLWFMLISFPLCVSLYMKFWNSEFLDKRIS